MAPFNYFIMAPKRFMLYTLQSLFLDASSKHSQGPHASNAFCTSYDPERLQV